MTILARAGGIVAIARGERRGVFMEHRGHRLDGRVAGEGPPARQHLVEDHAKGEQVRALVDGASGHLLRRHICHGADHGAHGGPRPGRELVEPLAFRLHELRDAEVEDLHAPIARDEEVVGLEVAVDDALAMCDGQSTRGLRGQVDDALGAERAALQSLAQGLALEQLGDEVGVSVCVADVVHREDVRVIEEPGGLAPPARSGAGGPGPRRTARAAP